MDNKDKLTDEQIQQMMDSKNLSGDRPEFYSLNDDAFVYDVLMKNLDEEPSFSIPVDFEKEILMKADRRKNLRDAKYNILTFFGVALPLISISYLVIYFMEPGLIQNMISILKSGSLYIVFSFVGLLLIQVLDKKLVQNKFNHLQDS